jgi:hypothetical protein
MKYFILTSVLFLSSCSDNDSPITAQSKFLDIKNNNYIEINIVNNNDEKYCISDEIRNSNYKFLEIFINGNKLKIENETNKKINMIDNFDVQSGLYVLNKGNNYIYINFDEYIKDVENSKIEYSFTLQYIKCAHLFDEIVQTPNSINFSGMSLK